MLVLSVSLGLCGEMTFTPEPRTFAHANGSFVYSIRVDPHRGAARIAGRNKVRRAAACKIHFSLAAFQQAPFRDASSWDRLRLRQSVLRSCRAACWAVWDMFRPATRSTLPSSALAPRDCA